MAIEQLEQSLKNHDSFKESCNNMIEWLKEMKSIQYSVDSHGTKEEISEKHQKLSAIKEKMPLGNCYLQLF